VAADLLAFYPEVLPVLEGAQTVFLVIGSERGFCGNLNASLLRHLEPTAETFYRILVGTKIHPPRGSEMDSDILLEGAVVTEEIADVLSRVVQALSRLQEERGPAKLYAIYPTGKGAVASRQLSPPFGHCLSHPPVDKIPPLLNLRPARFMFELAEEYLYAALYDLLYQAFAAENSSRLVHLDGAIRHLDERLLQANRRYNALRQEEIIEEIEVILLSTDSDSFAREFTGQKPRRAFRHQTLPR